MGLSAAGRVRLVLVTASRLLGVTPLVLLLLLVSPRLQHDPVLVWVVVRHRVVVAFLVGESEQLANGRQSLIRATGVVVSFEAFEPSDLPRVTGISVGSGQRHEPYWVATLLLVFFFLRL